ncbi:MAG: cupredoxin domain-containing protein [Solirubrobacteraceae bacterium]
MTRVPRVALACLALAFGGAFVTACGDDNESSADKQAPAPAATETVEPTETTSGGEEGSSEPVVVTMQGNRNAPEEIDVTVGQKIEWNNEDGYAHNVTSTSGEKIESGNFTDSFSYTPEKAGTIDYVCTIHQGQGGKITVK